jgi:hypothetical protein
MGEGSQFYLTSFDWLSQKDTNFCNTINCCLLIDQSTIGPRTKASLKRRWVSFSSVQALIPVTHSRTPSRDPFSSPSPSTSTTRSRRTEREPSLTALPPAPLGTGRAQAPQLTYIQTLTRQQIIATELFVHNVGHKTDF